MLARIRTRADEKEQGFTLIELLVVMIIIGILAAIAIPVFLSQREKAQDTAAKSDVSSIGKEITTYFVDNTVVPGNNSLAKTGSQWTFPNAQTVIGRVSQADMTLVGQHYTSATSWCVAIKNPNGSATAGNTTGTWKYSAVNGLQSGDCVANTDY